MKGNVIIALYAFGWKTLLCRMWKTCCSSNQTPSSLCLGVTCSKQCDKTQRGLNKVPLWHWTKQHVILRPYSDHQGGKGGTQQSHSYTHHLSQSNNPVYTIESSSVWHCGFLSGFVFLALLSVARRAGELSSKQRRREAGLYLKQRQRAETQRERKRISQVYHVRAEEEKEEDDFRKLVYFKRGLSKRCTP